MQNFKRWTRSLKSFNARTSPWKFSTITTFPIVQEQLVFICATSCVAHCKSCVSREKKSYTQIHNLFEQRNMNKEIMVDWTYCSFRAPPLSFKKRSQTWNLLQVLDIVVHWLITNNNVGRQSNLGIEEEKEKDLRIDHLSHIHVEWMMIHRLVFITIWSHYHLELRKVGLFIIMMVSDLQSFIDHWIIFVVLFIYFL